MRFTADSYDVGEGWDIFAQRDPSSAVVMNPEDYVFSQLASGQPATRRPIILFCYARQMCHTSH